MINTAVRGTKTWSEAQPSENPKIDKTQNISASDKGKLDNEDVGETLNRLSDPNYVDPAKKVRAVGNNKLDKDAFMKLMLAQMKNQDPTNPLKSHEMAAQLAQFSQLEQLQNVNNTLGEMQTSQKPNESFQALNFIGKSVSGDSSKIVRAKGDKDHDFNFALPDDAKEVKILVKNSQGEVIKKVELRGLKKGNNAFNWNGQDDKGNAVNAGEYSFNIEAKNGEKKLAVKTDFSGMITGVNYTPEGPVLLVGNQSIKMKDVRKIVDPSLMSNDQKSALDLKNTHQVSETDKVAGEAKTNSTANLMSSVGMSSGMMDKVANELSPDQNKQQAHAPVLKPQTTMKK